MHQRLERRSCSAKCAVCKHKKNRFCLAGNAVADATLTIDILAALRYYIDIAEIANCKQKLHLVYITFNKIRFGLLNNMQTDNKQDKEEPEEPTKVVFKKSSRKNLRQRKNSDDGDNEEQCVSTFSIY